jgi:hypothetical protein
MYRRGRRWTSAAAYTLFIGVGFVTFIAPLTSFTATLQGWLTFIWSLTLVVGGTLGVAGVVAKRPGLEFGGLPVLAASITVFGVVLIARGLSGASASVWGTVLVGMLMLALALKLLARFLDIGFLVRADSRRQDGSK